MVSPIASVSSPSTRVPAPKAFLGRPPSAWLALGGAAALVGPTIANPGGSGPVLCPFRLVTGLWCPGCGLTRATGWLAHGDVAASWRFHPWAIFLALQAFAAGTWWLWRRARGRPSTPPPALVPALAVINTVALGLIWVLRLKSGSFDRLA